jgi:hypothetical protein
MDMDRYQFRYNAYKNNTFDLDIVEKSIEESKMSAFQYLRKFQLDSTGYKRFDFRMREIYRTNKVNHTYTLVPRKWVFYLEHEFINVGKRLAYKRSELYEKELSFDVIKDRPDLFDSTFLVFIDGVLYLRGIQILCKEDKTYLVINCKEEPSKDGIAISDMRRFLENDVNVTIYFIPNIGIKNISTNAYRIRTLNNSTGIPLRTLNLPEYINYTNSLIYMNHVNSVESIATSGEITDTGLYINSDDVNDMIRNNPNNTATDITLIPLRNLLDRIPIQKGNKWFEIPMQDYPVAVENCLVTDISGRFIHDAKINHYYPNIYSIENIDEIIEVTDLYVYVFYYDNKFNQLKHLNMLASYHKYVPDYLERYKNGTINPMVKDFDPTIVDYTIKDYQKSEEYDDHFRYKIAKMKEFIKADPNNFKRYLRNLGLGNRYYYVDVSKIDLSLRKRKDNTDTKLDHVEFEEDMYMFIFRNDFRGMYDKIIIHVDGTRYQERIQVFRTDMLDYVYIPCELINADTVLEIEKVTDVKKEIPFRANNVTDILKINIGDFAVRNKTLYNDLFIVDKTTNKYVPPEAYQIILPVKFHMDDIESDIILDYIITETDDGYYQLSILDHGVLEIYTDDEMETAENAFFLSMQSNDNNFYQFDMSNNNANFNKVDFVNGYVTNKVRSMDKKMVYQFKMVDGLIKIEISEDDGTGKTFAEGGLNLVDINDVFIPCTKELKIRILDENYIGKDLSLYIKKHHNYEIIEDDLLMEDVIIYDVDGVPRKVPILRDQVRSRFYNTVHECPGVCFINDDGQIFKAGILKGRLQLSPVEEAEIDMDNTIIFKDLYTEDFNNKSIYRIYLNENNRLQTEQCTTEVEVSEELHIKDENGFYFILMTYNGRLATAPLNWDRDPGLDFFPIVFKTTSKNDYRYFRIYQNGRLIPRHISSIHFPEYSIVSDVELRLGFRRMLGVHYNIAVECMPYMMKQVCYLEDIPRDKVINLKGKIDKPFDFKWYDIYVNGKKLVKKDVEIVSANIIKILKTDSLHGLEIIENSRDKEYFGGFDVIRDIIDDLFETDKDFADNLNGSVADNENLKDDEMSHIGAIIDPLDYIVRQLYEFLIQSFGMINPDYLQLSESEIDRYGRLMDESGPMILGFDIYGENREGEEKDILPINPDA